MGETPSGKAILKDFYGPTKAEVTAKADAYRAAHPEGPPSVDATQLLLEFLAIWLNLVVKKHNAESTYESYLATIDLYIVDSIGQRPLCDLTPLIIQSWVNAIAATGKGRTAELALAILHTALNDAVAWEILKRNPAAHVSAPTFERKKAQAMTLAQAQAFMAAAGGRQDLRKPIMRKNGKKMTPIAINPRLEPLYLLYAIIGFRRGELLALRWSDINLETGEITITKSLDKHRREKGPKTESSIRTVYADETAREALKAHRERMQAEHHQEGWKHDGLVFCTEEGTSISPRNLLRHFKTVLAAAGLPSTFTLHGLRHSAGSLMLAEGAKLTDVSKTLGHSSVAITGKVYAHGYEEGKRAAVAGVGRKFRRTTDSGEGDAPRKGGDGV
ncbi:site-specific integrase [Chloroflexales bacterium ZM16-3]|nr:site-specific integrase [Chloroflexales bacterium ZM16-3]